jgi:integrase
MRRKISKQAIDRLKPGQILADGNPVGFVARRLKSGIVTYGFRYRHKDTGKQHWVGLGLGTELAPDQARHRALKLAAQARDGGTPVSAARAVSRRRRTMGVTVDRVLDEFLARYAVNLRSRDEITRTFRVYVRPMLGDKSVYDLKRLDIVNLLDRIEDSGAPVMADRVLAHLRRALRWHAARDEDFAVPIVPGMSRTKPQERARKRTLDDQEIRDLWAALDALHDTAAVPQCFARFVRMLLLSGQRRAMVGNARWEEIEGRDWIVPASRNKGKVDHLVPLTDGLLALLGPKGKGYVLTSDGGKTAFSGFSKAKTALDAKLAEIRKAAGRKPMQPWVFHDLRRTARSLMSRAGVSPDHAERVLGHVIAGVRGTYDRHEYAEEKRDALEKLSALIARILHPGKTVVSFPKRRKKR